MAATRKSNKRYDSVTLECLRGALAENQNTIRAFDTKAEILAVVLTLILAIANLAFPSSETASMEFSRIVIVVISTSGLIALLFSGLVLYPHHNPIKKVNLGSYVPSQTWYVPSGTALSVPEFRGRANSTDWESEIVCELLKTAVIMHRKGNWFRWSLRMSALTLGSALFLTLRNAFCG